jgi:hypothetical protein
MGATDIQLSVSLSLTKTVQLANWVTGALSLAQTGSRFVNSVMSVPIATTAIPLVMGTGTVGYTMIRSLETTTNNLLYILTTNSATTGASPMILGPGDVALFKAGAAMQTPYITPGTSASQIELMSFEL